MISKLPCFFGRHMFVQDRRQCSPLIWLVPQKLIFYFAICLITKVGSKNACMKCRGRAFSTELIRIALPPSDRSCPFQPASLSCTVWISGRNICRLGKGKNERMRRKPGCDLGYDHHQSPAASNRVRSNQRSSKRQLFHRVTATILATRAR